MTCYEGTLRGHRGRKLAKHLLVFKFIHESKVLRPRRHHPFERMDGGHARFRDWETHFGRGNSPAGSVWRRARCLQGDVLSSHG